MKSKTFIRITISLLLVGLILVVGVQIAIDPLFQYHTPWFGMEPVITNERYQNAGVAKSFEFNSVIAGNSMCENFVLSDFEETFDGKAVKLTSSGSYPLDWKYLLELLKNKHPNNILFNIDPLVFEASVSEFHFELPLYLYDKNLLTDVNYLFNFSIVTDYTFDTVYRNCSKTIPAYDSVFMWDEEGIYGKEKVLSSYERPEFSIEYTCTDEYEDKCKMNLNLLTPYIETMSDTEFVFFFSPFSMVYWDSTIRENMLEARKAEYLEACRILTGFNNVTVFLWTDDEMLSIMSDLNNYRDLGHYSASISELLLARMKKNEGIITKDNYILEVDKLFLYFESFDYDVLFE